MPLDFNEKKRIKDEDDLTQNLFIKKKQEILNLINKNYKCTTCKEKNYEIIEGMVDSKFINDKFNSKNPVLAKYNCFCIVTHCLGCGLEKRYLINYDLIKNKL